MFVVAKGRAVRHGLLTFQAGDLVTDSDVPGDRLERLVARGFLKPAVAVIDEDEAEEQRLVITKTKAGEEGEKTPEEHRADGRVSPTCWDFKPEQLEGRTLEQLNALIAERDASVEPCETVEEAIGLLCMDADLRPQE